jgi:hypothetical protein
VFTARYALGPYIKQIYFAIKRIKARIKKLFTFALFLYQLFVGLDSAVGIATRYGMKGAGTESLCGRGFAHPSRPFLGPTQLPVQWVEG